MTLPDVMVVDFAREALALHQDALLAGESRQKRWSGASGVLPVAAGGVEFGLPLESVRHVLHQLPTRLLPFGPPYLRETFDLGDELVAVLDLAEALGLAHAARLLDRKLVVLACSHVSLAICVDSIRDPEAFSANDLITPERVGGMLHGALARVLLAIVRTARGPLAVVDPVALLSPDRLEHLAAALASARDRPETEER